MDNNKYLDNYEERLKQALRLYLIDKHAIEAMLPDAPDIEEKWEGILNAYLPDGVREFNNYPAVSLGWCMFIGMAIAQFWDEDWTHYSALQDLYPLLRDDRGFDYMDEHICEDVLHLDADQSKALSQLVCDTALMAKSTLTHEFEAGSELAVYGYIRTLHQLYLMGAAMQLKKLGYHMQALS